MVQKEATFAGMNPQDRARWERGRPGRFVRRPLHASVPAASSAPLHARRALVVRHQRFQSCVKTST